MKPLTPSQTAALAVLVERADAGMPATYREVAARLGIRSTNAVSDLVAALEKKGYVERTRDGTVRSLIVLRRLDGTPWVRPTLGEPPRGDLTERQHQILTMIVQTIAERGRSPTFREIMAAFGFRGSNAVTDHLYAIWKKGRIELPRGRCRAIRVLPWRDDDLVGTAA